MRLLKIFALLLFLPTVTTPAQEVVKRLMITLPDTSPCRLERLELSFGPGADDYCYYYRGEPLILTTQSKTIGPFREEIARGMAYFFYNEKNKDQYLKNMANAAVHGPYNGVVQYIGTSSAGGLGYTVSSEDCTRYYINGNLIATIGNEAIDCPNDWCDFSDNGNVLYTLRRDKWNYLYLNGKLVDSSTYQYGLLDVDDNGNYTYRLGHHESARCFYRFHAVAHKPQNIFSPVNQRTMYLSYNDTIGYYANTVNYPSVEPYDKPGENYRVLTKGNTIFAYSSSDMRRTSNLLTPDSLPARLCVNGACRDLPYEKIVLTSFDSTGRYALLAIRDYYLYKNLNGVEIKQPLSKHGARANPLSLDVNGNTICYYESRDSVYVYQNDHLLKSCPIAQFNTSPLLTIGQYSYVVYNNELSPPLLKVGKTEGGKFEIGDIVLQGGNDQGYWLLQKTGYKKYKLMINNRQYPLADDVDFEDDRYRYWEYWFRLTPGAFTYYTRERSNIYRYTISL